MQENQLILVLVICIFIFILIRDFICWYFKTSAIANSIKESNRLLGELVKAQQGGDKRKKCLYCKESILVDAIKCRYCHSELPESEKTVQSEIKEEISIMVKNSENHSPVYDDPLVNRMKGMFKGKED